MRRLFATIVVGGMALAIPSVATASPSPNGPGQPGAPATTCGNANAGMTPGGSVAAGGSPFNASGTSGGVYAGNPGTASTANAQSPQAVSQYDIACFQVSSTH
jgi:hypothetical protein